MREQSASVGEARVLGYRLHPRSAHEVVGSIAAAVSSRRRLIMANLNLHGMAMMFESPAMARLLSQDDATVMIDSMPILLLANLLGQRLPRAKRTTSLDFYDTMFRQAVEGGWRIGYVGGAPETLEQGLTALRQRFPGLDIDGRHGFHGRPTDSEADPLLPWLRGRSHDVVIVGMGMPLQEEWIEAVQHRVPSRVFLSAGAYLDYQVGVQKAAPRWVGQVALEWAYRLLRSPYRLSYRYLAEPFVLLFRLATRAHPQQSMKRRP